MPRWPSIRNQTNNILLKPLYAFHNDDSGTTVRFYEFDNKDGSYSYQKVTTFPNGQERVENVNWGEFDYLVNYYKTKSNSFTPLHEQKVETKASS